MDHTEFFDFTGAKHLPKNAPLLSNIVHMQFQKGTTQLFWKTSYDQKEFKQTEFLKKKHIGQFTIFPCKSAPRGLEPIKLHDIRKKLCPLMPESKRAFWKELTTNETSLDLLRNYGKKKQPDDTANDDRVA